MKNKKKDNTNVMPVTAAATTATTPPAPAPVIAAAAADLSSLMQDLSFTSIVEIPDEIACAVNLPFTTILDSGTTVMLIKERHYFHTYSTADHVVETTTQQGTNKAPDCIYNCCKVTRCLVCYT
jgi:hypothetical protein